MSRTTERTLHGSAFAALQSVLAGGPIEVGHMYDSYALEPGEESWWRLTCGDEACRLLVEAHEEFTPRTMERLRHLTPAFLHQMGDPTVLVVAPWLSPRSRELLEERGWSYLDLTGTVLLRVRRPGVYVRLTGADHGPRGREPGEALLRGARINALIRVLVDVTPPYRVRDLAAATGLSESYVSRATATLHDAGLIDRPRAGAVTDVHWAALLRHRARAYDLLTDNRSRGFLTAGDPHDLVRRLRDDTDAVVTGGFATERAGADPLAVYVPDLRAFADAHGLRPRRSGANVLLLEPASPSQLERCRLVDGVRLAGHSQLAQDLISTGSPQGEDLLHRMAMSTDWRLPDLTPLRWPSRTTDAIGIAG